MSNSNWHMATKVSGTCGCPTQQTLRSVLKPSDRTESWLNKNCFSLRRLVSSLPLKMTDPAVKMVVDDIIRSPEDKRVYRGLEFSNGLKVMLVSDPTTDKSSAALDVHIGKRPIITQPRKSNFLTSWKYHFFVFQCVSLHITLMTLGSHLLRKLYEQIVISTNVLLG